VATKVRFSIPEREIENKGVVFVRLCNGKKHGSIRIRQNHIDWVPADHTYAHSISWEDFAKFAEGHPKTDKTL